jgi:predicted NBD/HSP70 family sugar kinase
MPGDTSRAAGRPGTAAFLRELNHRAVFDELARTARSRSQLAVRTGLSKPTISAALVHLQDAHLVRPSGFASGRSGPAAELFELDPTAGFVVGVQLGSRIEAAVADLNGAILARVGSPNRVRSAGPLATLVADVAGKAAKDAGVDLTDACAVVVAAPGVPHQPTRSVVRTSLAAAGQTGFLDELDRALDTACFVANDVNLAAVGEHRWGSAAGVPDFALVSLTPGLGLSAFVDGKLHQGVHGAAGEVALLPIVAEYTLNTLIRRASRFPGEQLMLEEATSSAGAVRLAHRLGLTDVRTAKDVYRAARAGDRIAKRVVRIHAQQLALTVAAAAAVLDPELIVISGPLDEKVAEHMQEALRTVNGVGPTVVAGRLGEAAVLLGAIAAALPRAHERVFARSQR